MLGRILRTRKRRIITGVLAALVVPAAAFAFYAAIINDGTGSATYHGALGANSNGSVTFTISANPGSNPSGLQPSTTECGTQSGQYLPNSACGGFNLLANTSSVPEAGTIDAVTLTGVTLPTGCPEDSVRVVWPDGNWTDGTGAGEQTYTEPSGAVTFTASESSAVEMFPQFSGAKTQSAQPLLWFYDDGTNQNGCAGGDVTLTFSAHAS